MITDRSTRAPSAAVVVEGQHPDGHTMTDARTIYCC